MPPVNEVLTQGQQQPPQTPQEPPSLRETLEKAVAANPLETPQEPVQARETDPVRRERALQQPREQGRFAKAPPSGQTVPTEEQVEEASEVKTPDQQPTPQEEQQQQEQTPLPDMAPKSWKAPVKAKWATLDPEVKQEITRREREIANGLRDAAPHKQFAQQFSETVAPYGQRYGQMGVTPLQLFKNFMDADTLLATAPMPTRAKFMAKMITDYGIDVAALDEALSGGDPRQQPLAQVESLIEAKLAPLNEFVQQTQQVRQRNLQREQNEQAQHIERMAQDTQKYPHFETVATDMADIMEINMKRGVYLTPEEAYKRAVSMNPDAQQAEQSAAGQRRAQEAHDAATRSLGASLSVSGSPAGLKQGVPADDLRGTIEAAWNAAQGR